MTRAELIAEIRKFDDVRFVIEYGDSPSDSTLDEMDREEFLKIALGYWALMNKILNNVVVID